MPLKEVIKEIEQRYNLSIRDPENSIEGKTLSYALWRFRPDVEQTLNNVLTPLDLVAQQEGERKYKIKKYQYHRLSPKEGKEKLDYLASLYNNKAEWEERKKELSGCIIGALQLENTPPRPNSEPIISNKRTRNGYTIENIALETLPGLYVCGSIYRPAKIKDKAPIILCPNGHFGDGRYRASQQIRCAMLARMGAIAISYDLFAWGESLLQFEPKDHHRSLAMTIQALNSLRLIDYLTSLPQADPGRVGITGGSGGGSQTILIAAIDDRIQVSVPVVMLSAIHSGGCPCESGMPVHLCGQGTNNVELAAMFAPKPQLVISDGGDWTANVPELEFPFLQRIYGFYDQTENIQNSHFPDEGHDYGPSKRHAMYTFMAETLGLEITLITDKKGSIDESTCTIEDKQDLYVFGPQGELLPKNAINSFKELENIFYESQKPNE